MFVFYVFVCNVMLVNRVSRYYHKTRPLFRLWNSKRWLWRLLVRNIYVCVYCYLLRLRLIRQQFVHRQFWLLLLVIIAAFTRENKNRIFCLYLNIFKKFIILIVRSFYICHNTTLISQLQFLWNTFWLIYINLN